jgi:hypothetical protein
MIRLHKVDSATTIYEWNKDLNTGQDEMLELTVRYSSEWGKLTDEASRIFIKPRWYDKPEYSFVSASLRLYAANVEGNATLTVPDDYYTVSPLHGTFTEGTGRYFDNPKIVDTIGSTWNLRGSYGSVQYPTPNASAGTFSQSLTNQDGGGVWFTGSNSGSISVSANDHETAYTLLEKESSYYDLSFDISTYMTHVSNSTTTLGANAGLVIKYTLEEQIGHPSVKYFSNSTNTIYGPVVEYKSDNYAWDTDKATIGTDQATVYYKGNLGKYNRRETVRFRPVVRETFPTASYGTASVADTIKTFTATKATYAIVDEKTDEEVIRFDSTYTRVCADDNGMWFDIDMGSLAPGRVYKPLLRVDGRLGSTGQYEYFDNKDYFEVV